MVEVLHTGMAPSRSRSILCAVDLDHVGAFVLDADDHAARPEPRRPSAGDRAPRSDVPVRSSAHRLKVGPWNPSLAVVLRQPSPWTGAKVIINACERRMMGVFHPSCFRFGGPAQDLTHAVRKITHAGPMSPLPVVEQHRSFRLAGLDGHDVGG